MFKWLDSLKIGQKIALGHGLAMGITILGMATAFFITNIYNDHADQLIEDAIEELLVLNRLERSLLLARNAQQKSILALDKPQLRQKKLAEFLQYVNYTRQAWLDLKLEYKYINAEDIGESQQEIITVQNLFANYQNLEPWLQQAELFSKSLNLSAKDPNKIEIVQLQLLLEANYNWSQKIEKFTSSLDQLIESIDLEYETAVLQLNQAKLWQIYIIIISLFLSLFTGLWVLRQTKLIITNPLQALTKVTQEVTQTSNFDLQVPITTTDEIGILGISINQLIEQVNQLLHQQVEANQKLSVYSQTLEQKVQVRTQELSQILEQLQSAQDEIIQSEKMAALGHLVAGIAHEINTPLGAIQASISNISNGLSQSLQQLPELFQQLPPERLQEFCWLLNRTTQSRELLSSREERQLRRTLKQALIEQEIESADSVADVLSKMAFNSDINTILPLLRLSNSLFIFNAAYHLASIQNNSHNIELAVERASKIVFSLKSYVHQNPLSAITKVSIPDEINTVLTLYQNQIKQGIQVTKNYQVVPDIWCYPEELTQVWSNLISNAIQAMNYQGDLKINVFAQDDQIIVEISDSGSGIPMDIQEKIFEPFFTTKSAGEGSGLGLHIVRQIIEKHQGTIKVISQVGYTVFSVYLPIVES
jgi:signal transduction histidine kinase